jgi:NitT/TauT family transport system permease protein
MLRKPLSRRAHVALGVASFVTLGALYTLLSAAVHAEQPNNKTIPTWWQLYDEGIRPAFIPRAETLQFADWDEAEKKVVWGEKSVVYPPLVWVDGQATLGRLFAALGLAALVAVPLGLLMGCYQIVEGYFLPPLMFLAKIAPTAMIAVFMTVTTTVFQFYVAIIIFGLIPTLAQAVFHAAKEDVPEELLFKASTLGATQIECIWDVIFKYILPKVMEAVRLQVGPAIVYLMAAEWARGEVGFGCRMRLLQKSLDMSIIYTYLITLGVFGLLIDRLFIWVQRKLCPWYGGE